MKWGLWCQKQVSQAGISNYIPQFTVGCSYLCMPEIPASSTKVCKYQETCKGFVSYFDDVFINMSDILPRSQSWILGSWHAEYLVQHALTLTGSFRLIILNWKETKNCQKFPAAKMRPYWPCINFCQSSSEEHAHISRTWPQWVNGITVTSYWVWWRFKSPAPHLFTQQFIQLQIKENIKAPHHWPLWGEFTGGRWIPRT